MDWYNLSVAEVEKKLKTNIKNGFTKKDANNALKIFGKNILTQKKKKGFFFKFLEQISDTMVIILLIAAVISFFSSYFEGKNDYIDSIVITFIVLINAIIGVFQENKAERAIEALNKLSAPKAKVIRSGKEYTILSENVVPGDILVLEAGDFIPADARIIYSENFKTEESSLTGESLPIKKDATTFSKKNTVFASSTVVSGRTQAVVFATGMKTEVGKIANIINKLKKSKTPLQKKLEKVGKTLGVAAIFICLLIFTLGILHRIPLMEIFMVSISLAVAVIPEGLPAIVTIVLALGVRKIAQKRAISKKLSAIETLGSISVICSDKTGTLTQNKMTVTILATSEKNIDFKSNEGLLILSLAGLCNNSKIKKSFSGKIESGNQTELSVLRALENIDVKKEELEKNFPRFKEIPFNSKRKLMSTIHKIGKKKYRIITKGAPDVLLPLCSNKNQKEAIKKNEKLAKSGLRVLAVSYKDVDYIPKNEKEIEKELNFAGFIGMMDPLRPEVKNAVNDCKKAGIKPVMITGDQTATAINIGKKLEIFKEGDQILTGQEIEKMTDAQLFTKIYKYSIFARVVPEHKVRIVKAFQSRGEVVAMTGDGVNDAPALKASDVGCAMGLSGTDVAKEAADIIITDDNFSTIVEAIHQGRGIYENIKKTAYFLLSSNIGEVLTILTSSLMYLPMPLLAIQLLWVNLVTDSFPALALGASPVNKNIMKRKPIKRNQGLFSGISKYTMAVEGTFISAISILAFVAGKNFFDKGSDPIVGRTMSFVVLGLSQVFHVFNVNNSKSIFKSNIFLNTKIIYSFILCMILQFSVITIPELSKIFKTAKLDFTAWSICLILSISPIVLVEIEKCIVKNRFHICK